MRVLELNEKNFNEFGIIIKRNVKHLIVNEESFRYYLVSAMKESNEISIGILEVTEEAKEVTTMERHKFTEEAILPFRGRALLYLASRNKMSLSENDIVAFEIEPGIGVKLYRNVWHAIPIKKSKGTFFCGILKAMASEEDLIFTKVI
jgi:ureidoglycolate hydrolase